MLSVITITYNNFSELILTLNSLAETNIQSVIVNGGTDQETFEYLKKISSFSISESDHGISDAFNKGLQNSNGEFVTFLNSGDVLIDKNYYSEALKILDSDSSLDFVYADIAFIDQYAGEIRVKSGSQLPSMPYLHPTLIVRRNAMQKAGLFNLEYKIAMDLDFAYRLTKSGSKGSYIPRMVVCMNGQGVSSINFFRAYKEVVNIIIRNQDYTFRSLIFIINRFILLLAKWVLLKSKGERILGWYRKKRYLN